MRKFGERNGQCNMKNKNITYKDINEAFLMIQLIDLSEMYTTCNIRYNDTSVSIHFKTDDKKEFNRLCNNLLEKTVPFAIDFSINKMIVTVSVNSLDAITYTKYDNIKTRLYEYIKNKREA